MKRKTGSLKSRTKAYKITTAKPNESPLLAIARGRGVRTAPVGKFGGTPRSSHSSSLSHPQESASIDDLAIVNPAEPFAGNFHFISDSHSGAKRLLKDEDYFHGYSRREVAPFKLNRPGEFLVRAYLNKQEKEVYEIALVIGEEVRFFTIGYNSKYFFVRDYSFESVAALIAFHRRNKVPIDSAGSILRSGIPRDRWILKTDNVKRRRTIGTSINSRVYFATLSYGIFNKVQVAVRIYTGAMTPKDRATLQSEIEYLYYLDHPNIVKTYGACVYDSPVQVVTEMALGGTLLDAIQARPGPTEQVRRNFVIGACKGMAYLESKRLINHNILAKKILLTETGEVKLSDFGLSLFRYDLSNGDSRKTAPLRYLPPEVLEKSRFVLGSDVWMFGTLIWEIFNDGNKPFSAITDTEKVVEAILNGRRLDNENNAVPANLFPICNQCFRQKSSDRPSFEIILRMLVAEGGR